MDPNLAWYFWLNKSQNRLLLLILWKNCFVQLRKPTFIIFWFWFVEHCQTSPNKNKSQNLWQVTSILVCCIFAPDHRVILDHETFQIFVIWLKNESQTYAIFAVCFTTNTALQQRYTFASPLHTEFIFWQPKWIVTAEKC